VGRLVFISCIYERSGAWLLIGLLAGAPLQSTAVSLDRDLAEAGHRSWTIRDGSLPQRPYSLAQTTDGFIWVGTDDGLLRFDGVGFSAWPSLAHTPLARSVVYSLLSCADGSLWVGTDRGVTRIQRGSQQDFPGESGAEVVYMTQDSRHRVWVLYAKAVERVLCKIEGDRQSCFGPEAKVPQEQGWSLLADDTGEIWIGTSTSVHRWSEGSDNSFPVHGLESNGHVEGVMALASDRRGSVLVGVAKEGAGRGLERLTDGKWSAVSLPGIDSSSLHVGSLLYDRNGALWIGTIADGIYRLHDGRVDHYSTGDGLSGPFVQGFLQDREGTVWAFTNDGIDQFRDLAVVSLTNRRDLQAKEIDSVTTAHDGSLWVGGVEILAALAPGSGGFVSKADELSNLQVTTVFEDAEQRMWVGTDDKLNTLDRGHLTQLPMADGSPAGMIVSMAEDRQHALWAVSLGPPRRVLRVDPVGRTAHAVTGLPPATKIASDAQDGIWLGLVNGDLGHYAREKLETFHVPHDNPSSRVYQLAAESDGSVLASTGFGLLGWKSGRVALMSSRNGLPCDRLFASLTDREGNLWLYTQCGLVKIENTQLHHWWVDPMAHLHPRLFDAVDGARTGAAPFSGAARTPDGRLWFANDDVVQMVDPGNLADNRWVPPVYVESLIADGRYYPPTGSITVPPLTHAFIIGYTAPSFVAPQKVRFRYKLEGFDEGWNEAGTRRQAFYSQLPPGKYRFHVSAANNSGIWNETGASFDLLVAPALYQTVWAKVLGSLVLAGLVGVIFRRRVHEAATRMQMRDSARLAERERIARQIHDTFLQSVQAFLLRLSTVKDQVADTRQPQLVLDELVQLSSSVADEVRGGIHGLRELPVHVTGIAEALSALGRDLVAHRPIEFDLTVIGNVRALASEAYENLSAIGQEAIRNAVLHADASTIHVELRYHRTHLTLLVRDNGRGIDRRLLKHGREGHWGLRGMRERARVTRSRLNIVSSPGSGTELKIVVPAEVAFGLPARHWLTRRRNTPLTST
jgi:signal transduction histidine kinase/ligand-binding sensor domain-containing protein